ncbi:MAG: 2'-5' RNA ligase family protein [Candidatus Saccharimonadia bacterium]
MQCFIGIDVGQPLSESILNLKNDWDKLQLPPANFHKHTHPHITIIPPFWTKDVLKMADDLTEITQVFGQFDADYAKVGAFNHRILHISVSSNGIVDLAAKLFYYGRGIYDFLDQHPVYHAHTTVGYTKAPMTQKEYLIVAKKLSDYLAIPMHQEISSISIYGRETENMDYRTLGFLPLYT